MHEIDAPAARQTARSFPLDQTFDFDVTPAEFWAFTVGQADRFRDWWSWLRRLEVGAVEPGGEARFEIATPLFRWTVKVTILIEEVVAGRLLSATVAGDVSGRARLELEPSARGCRARLWWEVTPRSRVMRAVARVAWPLQVAAQDWVIATGVRQFVARLVAEPAPGEVAATG